MYFYVRPLQLLPKPSEARGSEQVCGEGLGHTSSSCTKKRGRFADGQATVGGATGALRPTKWPL